MATTIPDAGISPGYIPDDSYLLVSDSDEACNQLDSKKLNQADFVELAQNNLFSKNLGYMSEYMTKGQLNAYKDIIGGKLNIQQQLFDELEDEKRINKFKVVDGQVILLEAESTDSALNGKTLLEYLHEYWDIPSEYTVEQWQDCMLRGVTFMRTESALVNPTNSLIGLTEENMPPHMHHSGITQGTFMETLRGPETESTLAASRQSIVYDMFYNDSFSTGLDKNELDGTVDQFEVKPVGE